VLRAGQIQGEDPVVFGVSTKIESFQLVRFDTLKIIKTEIKFRRLQASK
jgi:hypothetical protein